MSSKNEKRNVRDYFWYTRFRNFTISAKVPLKPLRVFLKARNPVSKRIELLEESEDAWTSEML